MKTINCSFRADETLVRDLDKTAKSLGISRAEAIRTTVGIGLQAISAARRDASAAGFKGQTQSRLLIQMLGGMFADEKQMDLLEALVELENAK